MEFYELLQKLRRYRPTRYLFATEYVNAHWTEEFHKKRTALFFKNEWNDAIERLRRNGASNEVMQALQHDRERIEEHLRDAMRGTIDGRYRGLVFFATGGNGLFEVFRSHVEFEDRLIISDRPQLKQFARLGDEYEAIMLVMIDSSRARVYELKLAGIDEYLRVVDEVPGRHKVGGRSQMRFQRHVDDHHDRHHKEVARAVEKLFDEENLKNVIIAGQETVITDFARFLPKRVREKVFATIHMDMTQPEDEVIRTVLDHLQHHERAKENRGVRGAINQAAIGGKGTVGVLATVRAVNERLVHVLYLSEGFALAGSRCRSCKLLSTSADRCPYCSGELTEVDLGEAMADDVLEAGGEVDVVRDSAELESFEGVAAATRFEKLAQKG